MSTVNDLITKDPDILGGTPVFRGTRVPFQSLLDYLEAGQTLDDFLMTSQRSRGKQRSRLWNTRTTRSQPTSMKLLLDECLPKNSTPNLVGTNA